MTETVTVNIQRLMFGMFGMYGMLEMLDTLDMLGIEYVCPPKGKKLILLLSHDNMCLRVHVGMLAPMLDT